jgi:hypothetical protein
MFKPFAQPRQIGAAVLVLAALTLLSLPATGLAAPPVEGAGSPLSVSPSPIVAPATTVGYNGQALEVEIANPGEEASIEKVTIEGAEAGEFFSNGSNCSTLGEGQKCQFFFGLKPGSAGLKQATMVVTFQGGRSPESFAVSGEAVEPELEFSPSGHDFGLRRINGETVSTSFQLTNVGAAPVQINILEIQGDTSVFWTGNTNCWSGALASGQSCSVEVNFNPHDRVSYSAELRAVVNGSAFGATLNGRGGRAVIASTENPFDFGAATVGSQSGVRAITIANSGDLPAGFFIAVIAGGDAGSFQLLDENCTGGELLPAASCTAHVRFAPQGPGPKLARLALFGDGEDGTMVFLKGEGVAPKVMMTPTSFDFGRLSNGSRGPARTFAIRNEGSTPVLLGAAAIVGANLDQFLLAGDECTGVLLGPGRECLVRLRFAPETIGAKTATLRVGGDVGALTASLAGLGVAPQKAGAVSSGAPGRRFRFVRGAVLNSAKAHCRVSGACHKGARASGNGGAHHRAAR